MTTCPIAMPTTTVGTRAPAQALLSRRRWVIVAGYGIVGIVGIAWVGRAGLPKPEMPTVTSWWWAAVAVIACGASFWGAAAAVLAVTPVRLSHRAVVATQVAASATKLVTPTSVGLVGLNARLLQSQGARLPMAIAAIAGGQLAQVVLTVTGLAVVLLTSGLSLPMPSTASHVWLAVAAVACAAAAAGVAVTVGGRRFAAGVRRLKALLEPLSMLLRSPGRVLLIVVGAAGVTASLTLCLYACVRALGADASLAGMAVVLLVGSSLGSALPTPGGIGGVENAMVASSLAVGVPVETALPAVLAFRLVSFWLPAPFGVVAMVWLRRAGHL